MDFTEDAGHIEPDGDIGAPDQLLLAPAAILDGLPDAVVAAARDERIVFVNALAEELFGYSRKELLGQPVQTLWPPRVRERYTRNMRLYFRDGPSAQVHERGAGAAA
jgi:PAS domain S-box-containing protein